MRYRADNEMSVLEYRGNDWRKWTGGVNGLPLNQEIRFRVQSKLDKDYERKLPLTNENQILYLNRDVCVYAART